MRKLLLPFLLLFAAIPLGAESVTVGGQWRGLHDGDASMMISDNEAQATLNADITVSGYGIKKRDGYASYKSLTISTSAVRGGYYFRSAAGSDMIIHAHDVYVAKSAGGGAYTNFITTATNGAYWDFTDSQGSLYGVNSAHDTPFVYDGVTLTYSTTIPAGTQIEALADRLVVAGTAANPNGLYFSAEANFTNFTNDIQPSSPFVDTVGLPGQNILAIKYAMGRLFIWTRTTCSFWYGTNQFDAVIKDISTTIGIAQATSVIYDNGILYWQGQDSHFYSYDGNIITKISEKIAGSVAGFSGVADYQSWTLTTQADFSVGTFGVPISSITSPGDIVFSPYLIDNFYDGDYTSSPVWTPVNVLAGSTWSVKSAEAFLSSAPAYAGEAYGTLYTPVPTSTGTWYVDFRTQVLSTNPFDFILLKLCTHTPTTTLAAEAGCANVKFFNRSAYIYNGTVFATSVTAGPYLDGNPHTVSFERRLDSTVYESVDGPVILSTSISISSYSYLSVGGDMGTTGQGYYFDNVYFNYFASTYTSPVHNVGAGITSWGSLDISNVLNGGSLNYGFYACATSNCSSTTFTSSQTITSGNAPTVAVQPFACWSAGFNRTASTQTPTVNDVTINWFASSQTHNWATIDKNRRIMWSVAENSAASPNVEYIYDPRFDSWLKYSFPFEAPAVVNQYVYFGSTSAGSIFRWPSGASDNGAAINSYWKSKDFISGDPYSEKQYQSLSLIAKTQTGSSLTLTYTVNTSTSGSYAISLTDVNSNSLIRNNYYLPSGLFGTFFNYQFGNNAANSPFEVYTVRYDYKPKPWRVLP